MATIKRYVSAITSLDQREINPNIIDIENNYGICDVLNAFGRYKSSKMYKVESFVNEQLWKAGVAGTVVGSGTATLTVPLTLATSPNRRKNDQVMLPNGKTGDVTAAVYAGDPAASIVTLTIVSVDGTNLTLANGGVVKFFSNAVGEKSISRDSQFFGTTHMYNLLQIFRETHRTSDVQLLSKVEAPASGNWTTKEYAEKFLKHKTEVNAAHLAGQISVSQFSSATSALTDAEGGGIKQYERGLLQYTETFGVNQDVDVAGVVDMDDLSQFIDGLVAKKAQNKYTVFAATAPMGKLDDTLKGLNSAGITSARMNMDGRDIDFMVDKVTYKGFNLQKMLLPILNQPDIFGGTKFDNGFFFLPEGRVGTLDRDGQSSYQPRVQIRYKPQPKVVANKGNEIWGEAHSGMYSEVNPSGEVAEAVVNWTTAQCLEVNGAQHTGYLGDAVVNL